MGDPTWKADPEALLAQAGWVRGLARRLVAEPARADDVAQEAWLEALERPPAHAGNLPSWLASVVRNAARQLGRAESRRGRRERAAHEEGAAPSAAELVEQAEMQREVVGAVLALDEPQRATVLLRYWRGLAPQEIARLQGVPAGTVRSRLHRAQAELRERLDRRFQGDRAAWSTVLLAWIRAREGAPAAGAGGAAALLGGAAVMGWKAVLAVALVGGLGAVWWAWPEGAREATGAGRGAREAADAAFVRAAPSPADEAEPARSDATPDPGTRRSMAAERDPLVRGRVRAPDGTAVAGAELTLLVRRAGADWERAARAASDGEGSFSLRASAAPSDEMAVRAEADGFQAVEEDAGARGEALELVLPWLGALAGRVVDAETGAPIAGARIVGDADLVTAADANGDYRLEGVPTERQLSLYARDEEHVEGAAYFMLHGPEEMRLDFRLERGRPLVVEVIDRETGLPVADAEVRVNPRIAAFARTDAHGRFTTRIVEGERQHLVVAAEGFVPFVWSREVEDAERALAPRIPLAPWGFVEGTVTDQRGRPQAGVPLHVRRDEPIFGLAPLDADARRALDLPGHAGHEVPLRRALRSDAAGAFRIPVLPGHGPLRIRAARADGATAASERVRVERGRESVRVAIALGAGATVRGRVLFNGAPQAGVEVRWGTAEEPQLGAERTDGDGRYELRNVRPGRVALWLVGGELQRFGPTPRAELELDAGASREHDFAWSAALASLSGRVVTESGAPVAGARVEAAPRGRELARFEAESGQDGVFRFDVLAGETYTLSARKQPVSCTRAGVPAGTRGLELVLPELGVLRIQLVDADTGQPLQPSVGEVGLFWRPSGEHAYRRLYVRVGLDGSGALPLPVGLVDLQVRASGLGRAPARVSGLAVGGEPGRAPVRIELSRGVSARLELEREGAASASLQGHELLLLEEEQLARLRRTLPAWVDGADLDRASHRYLQVDPGLEDQLFEPDDRGRVHVSGLAPGRYALRALPDDLVLTPDRVELGTGGGAAPVRVRYRAR